MARPIICDFCEKEIKEDNSVELAFNKIHEYGTPLSRGSFDFCNMDCLDGWKDLRERGVVRCVTRDKKGNEKVTYTHKGKEVKKEELEETDGHYYVKR